MEYNMPGRKKSNQPFFAVYNGQNYGADFVVVDSATNNVLTRKNSLLEANSIAKGLLAEVEYKGYQKTVRRVYENFPYDSDDMRPIVHLRNHIEDPALTKHLKRPEISINRKFEYMEKLVKMVIEGNVVGLAICGCPGLGKSYTVMNVFREYGLEPDEDYVLIKGTSSPLGLYKSLYDNQNGIIVYDDCDDVILNNKCSMILKAALDTTEERVISWNSPAVERDPNLDTSFVFNGRVIFISNLTIDKFDSAIISRSYCVDVDCSKQECMMRIKHLAKYMCTDLKDYQLVDILDYIEKKYEYIADLNLRTLIKLANLRLGDDDWIEVADYLFLK
jgi:hypothetical protein